MESLDIISLIERNPLTRLNRQYQSRFVQKIQQYFSSADQQFFVSSFYCYLNHDSKTDFVIDLDDVWKWLGFSRKDHAKRTLERNFTVNVDYKGVFPRAGENPNSTENKGGRPNESMLMNIETFKTLCMLAGTDKSKEIRAYFIKLEQVFHELLKEESDELRMQLEFKNTQIAKVQSDSEKHRHNILLQEFKDDCNIVYIMKVSTIRDKYIIKIGESRRGITGRYADHRSSYPECTVLDCFGVKRSKDFEKFLHSSLSAYKYQDLPGHENENELFVVGGELSYSHIMDLVKNNIGNYNDDQLEVNKYLLEIEKLKLENDNLRLLLSQQPKQEHPSPIDLTDLRTDIISCIKEEIRKIYIPGVTRFGEQLPNTGPYVQQLNADNLSLIRVFENVAEVCKVFDVPRSSVSKAVKENTIYKGFRWNFVERHLDPHIQQEVEPTRALQKQQNLGYIAKLNSDKSEIINVYLDRKTASIQNGYESVAYLDYFVKNAKAVDSHYYLLYDTLADTIKAAFLAKHNIAEIILYKKFGVGQFDTEGNLMREFRSKHHCQETLKFGEKTMCKAIETGTGVTLLSGTTAYFKYLSDKLSI